MNVNEWFGVLKDGVVTTVSIVGGCVAVKGLSTWKRQIKGQSEYALAKESLINIYKLRDEIARVRNPFMTSQEMPEPPPERKEKMTSDEIRFYGLSGAYQQRWDRIALLKSTVSVNLTEAEAIWGKDLKGLVEVYFGLINNLHSRIYQFLRTVDPTAEGKAKEIYIKDMANIHDVIYDNLNEDDLFNSKLNESIRPIEIYLRKKMSD